MVSLVGVTRSIRPRYLRCSYKSALFLAAPIIGASIINVLSSGSSLSQETAQASGPPPSVIVAPVQLRDATDRVHFIGNVQATQQVDVRARVEGFLEKVAFAEGSFIEAGTVLYEIEKAPFQATLDQAKATLSASEAQVASAQASLKQREAELSRQTTLARQQFASQAVLDQATALRDQAAASVREAEAQILSARAQIETANLNLSYATISAPISGRIGKSAITVGNLVSPSSGPLATIVQTSPIRVAFSIPDRDYVTVKKSIAEKQGEGRTDNYDQFTPRLLLPDGTMYDQAGKIEFVSNQIDPSTGTVSVWASFDNRNDLLLPGEYVSVTVQVGKPQMLPNVPQTAILQDGQGNYVYLVDNDNRVQKRQIKVGPGTKDGVSVESGLQEGESVIVDGIQKARPGIIVQPVAEQGPSSTGTSR